LLSSATLNLLDGLGVASLSVPRLRAYLQIQRSGQRLPGGTIILGRGAVGRS
jgi:hypothetical protein